MFDFAPAVWCSFPWGHGIEDGQGFSENREFTMFSRKFVGMLDMAIDMLGPDMDIVEEQLQELGVRHIAFGVMPKHYPLMGRALMDTLKEKLGERFTPTHKESWNTIYTFMSVSMMQGGFQELMRSYGKHIWQEEVKDTAIVKRQSRSSHARTPDPPVKAMVNRQSHSSHARTPDPPVKEIVRCSTASTAASSVTSHSSSKSNSSKTSVDQPPRAVASSSRRKSKSNNDKKRGVTWRTRVKSELHSLGWK